MTETYEDANRNRENYQEEQSEEQEKSRKFKKIKKIVFGCRLIVDRKNQQTDNR